MNKFWAGESPEESSELVHISTLEHDLGYALYLLSVEVEIRLGTRAKANCPKVAHNRVFWSRWLLIYVVGTRDEILTINKK